MADQPIPHLPIASLHWKAGIQDYQEVTGFGIGAMRRPE